MSQYKVSIIIPVYNVQQYIAKCLLSVLNQSFESIEYILVDDCGSDQSIEIANSIIDGHPKRNQVKILHHSQNMGISCARNTGINNSVGEYILNLDSDDYLEPGIILKMYDFAIANDVDILVTDYFDEKLDGIKKYNKQEFKIKEKNNSEEFIKLLLSYKIAPAIWNKFIRASLYKQNKITHPAGIPIIEDVCTLVQLAHYANKIMKLDFPSVHYIQHITSASFNPRLASFLLSAPIMLEDFFRNENVYEIYDKYLDIFRLKTEYAYLIRTLWQYKIQLNYNLNKKTNFKIFFSSDFSFKQKLILFVYCKNAKLSNIILKIWTYLALFYHKIV